MHDVDLIDTVATRIEAGLAAAGYPNIPVLQNYQPNQQGVPIGNSVWIEKLFDKPIGWTENRLKWYESSQIYQESESQNYNTPFQISVLLPQVPGDTTLPTASDMANFLQRWMTSRATRRLFKGLGISIFRVTDVRNSKFQDDQSQYEARPSFDLTINHNNALITDVHPVYRVEGKLIGVGGEFGPVEDDSTTD